MVRLCVTINVLDKNFKEKIGICTDGLQRKTAAFTIKHMNILHK